MNLKDALAQISMPVGVTSMISALLGGDTKSVEQPAISDLTLEQVRALLATTRKAQEICGSDAAWWGYEGQVGYLQAVADVMAAADLVGPDNLFDIKPRVGGVLMDQISAITQYGKEQLELARAQTATNLSGRPGTAKTIAPSMEELKAGAKAFLDLINAQTKDTDKHQVVFAGLYAMGGACAQFGIILRMDAQIGGALPPFAAGYQNAREAMAAKGLLEPVGAPVGAQNGSSAPSEAEGG
jgi:hypothetical protein